MKIKRFIGYVFILLSLPGFAQEEGIKFREISFTEALKQAQTEKKLLFVDCYTTWCGPCKEMSTKIFPLVEAGKFFNSRFVSIKSDMEKGEGIDLSKKFKIKVYPTFLIITPEGIEQYRITGKMKLNELIEKVTLGLDEKNSITYLSERLEKNELSKEELYNYTITLINASEFELASKTSTQLFSALSDQEKIDAKYWPIFSNYYISPITSDKFKFILEHKQKFEELVGANIVNEALFYLYNYITQSYIAGYFYKKDGNIAQDSIELVLGQIKKLNLPEKQQTLELKGKMAQARCANDIDEMIRVSEQLLPLCSPKEAWSLATFFLTLTVKDDTNIKKLKQLEDNFLKYLPDEKMQGFIKDSFGKNKVHAVEVNR